VIAGVVYLICVFLLIPLLFVFWSAKVKDQTTPFPHDRLAEYLSALLSICCMLFLGFADDVLNLRWRYKLFLPTIATIPLLLVYLATYNQTTVLIPKPFQFIFGVSYNLGIMYYLYMGLLAVFCTNSINILAGINGVEAGQSLVIAIAVAVNNVYEIYKDDCCVEDNYLSLVLIVPFIGTTLGLLWHNWFPARVFVGDTYCYFAGMMFAVVGILGHFGKTLLLFFIPQIFNFLYSTPQLFKIIPCPRHRMPSYNAETKLVEMSYTEIKYEQMGIITRLVVFIIEKFNLAHIIRKKRHLQMSNLTILNFILRITGPIREVTLTKILIALQLVSCAFALFIRYPLLYFIDNL